MYTVNKAEINYTSQDLYNNFNAQEHVAVNILSVQIKKLQDKIVRGRGSMKKGKHTSVASHAVGL